MLEPSVYRERRAALISKMRERGATRGSILLSAHGESPINYRDNAYPFRQDSVWLYFIGLNEPDMAALLDISDGNCTLIGTETTIDEMVWTGPRPRLAELASSSGIESSMEWNLAGRTLSGKDRNRLPIFFPPTCRTDTAVRIAAFAGVSPEEAKAGNSEDLILSIIELREIKEAIEVEEMEKAVSATVRMHTALLTSLRPGWKESQASACVLKESVEQGCSLSFSTVATVRGEVLHNHSRSRVCREGDNFLLDAGAETDSGYAGDLTTTFPVGSRFDGRSADIYRLLVSVFGEATGALKPGVKFIDVHLAASLRLARGLVELGIMRGDPKEAVASGAHALFFPHGLGHMIGLDVHDMEGLGEDKVGYGSMKRSAQFGLKSLRLAKTLKPGMTHTVEPGIYFIPGLIESWRASRLHEAFIRYEEIGKWLRCGGMRVEEDWLVTTDGARRLGPPLDKSIEAIEEARRLS